MAELEFKGGLYCDDASRVIMPAEGIEAIVRAGARKSKEGKVVESGVFCLEDAILEYTGKPPKGCEDVPSMLWEQQDTFAIEASVKVGQSRVIRTRPIFQEWFVDITLQFNPDVCNESQIYGWLCVAGDQCGAFDWRPRHGRFSVERLDATGQVLEEAA